MLQMLCCASMFAASQLCHFAWLARPTALVGLGGLCSWCCFNLPTSGTLSICLLCVSLANVQQAVGNPSFHCSCIHKGEKYPQQCFDIFLKRWTLQLAFSGWKVWTWWCTMCQLPLLWNVGQVWLTFFDHSSLCAVLHLFSLWQLSPIPLQLTGLLASGCDLFDERGLTYLFQRKIALQISCRWQLSPSLLIVFQRCESPQGSLACCLVQCSSKHGVCSIPPLATLLPVDITT